MVALAPERTLSTQLIKEEAEKMGYAVTVLCAEKNFLTIQKSKKTYVFKNIDCGLNSSLALKIANDKELSSILLEKNSLPVPKTIEMLRNKLAIRGQINMHKYAKYN